MLKYQHTHAPLWAFFTLFSVPHLAYAQEEAPKDSDTDSLVDLIDAALGDDESAAPAPQDNEAEPPAQEDSPPIADAGEVPVEQIDEREPPKPAEKPAEPPPSPIQPAPTVQPASPVQSSPINAPPAALETATPEKAATPETAGTPEKDITKAANQYKPPFFEGEPSNLGISKWLNQNSAFGVGLGLLGADKTFVGILRPSLNLQLKQLNTHIQLEAPLRFQVLDFTQFNVLDPASYSQSAAGFGTFFSEDWDSWDEYVKAVQNITIGREGEPFYLSLSRVQPLTLGNGQLVRRYAPNSDISSNQLFGSLDVDTQFGGFELIGGPIPSLRVLGGRAFINPLGFWKEQPLLASIRMGASYVTDQKAPTVLLSIPNPADGRRQYAVDEDGQLVFESIEVKGMGVDAEIEPFRNDWVSVKVYGDYSILDTLTFQDDATTVGSLIRFSFGQKALRKLDDESEEVRTNKVPRQMKAEHGIRLRLEGKLMGAQYLPSYFDSMYEQDRLQFSAVKVDDPKSSVGKLQFLNDQAGEPNRFGVYAELGYAWADAFAVSATYEDAFTPGQGFFKPARGLTLHAESGGLGWIQGFATYRYRNFDGFDFSHMFKLDSEFETLVVGGRVQVLPFLFLNVSSQKSFRVGFADDDIGVRPLPNFGPDRKFRFTTLGLTNDWLTDIGVEIGWQF